MASTTLHNTALLVTLGLGLPLYCAADARAQETSPPSESAPHGAEAPPSQSEAPADGGGDDASPPERAPGDRAVERVRKLGFRMSSREPSEPPSSAEEPAPSVGAKSDPTADPDSLPMRLGRVQENVALPPEVAELAKAGALAVADADWKGARDAYLGMIRIAPDNSLGYANLGVAEHQLGNLLSAAGNLAKATEISPHVARNWQTLGLIQFERGELALALSSLARAVHEAPDEAETRIILAAVAREFGWPDTAIVELQRAVEIDPRSAAAHYNLAVAHLEAEPPRLELARRHYYAAVDLGTPPSPEIETVLNAAP